MVVSHAVHLPLLELTKVSALITPPEQSQSVLFVVLPVTFEIGAVTPVITAESMLLPIDEVPFKH
jgi:hypothetical protein